MPSSLHSYLIFLSPDNTKQPPNCVKIPSFNSSSVGLSLFQFCNEIPIIFCNRSVANSNGRRPQFPTTGNCVNLFIICVLPSISFISIALFGHLPAF